MKKIDIKLYIKWIGLFVLWFIIFNLMQLIHIAWIISFIKIFIQISLLILFINTSTIFFYKSLNTKDEYFKYAFSFINIFILLFIAYIFKVI